MLAGRRGLLLAAVATPAVATPGELRFRIVRQGSNIGTHKVGFGDTAAGLSAVTEVDIAVRIAGITVFRLGHRFEEVWQSERLVRATSRLDRNGKVTVFNVRAEDGGLRVEGPDGVQRLPAEAAPLTWWDARRVTRPALSNDTGKALRLTWARGDAPGGGVRWRCEGDEQGEATYAADGTWLDWQTKGDDGSLVTYTRA